jgi:hypothetical protein
VGWAFVWLFVVLKIPVIAALWLVWWSIRDPEPPEEPRGDGGGSDRGPHRHPRPRRPGPTRRGPHGEPIGAPRRVRAGARHERHPARTRRQPTRR